MIARIQVRRDLSTEWTANNISNPIILALGEIGYETDTNRFKIGDGTNDWSQLNYELGQWNSDSSGNITYGSRVDEGNVTVESDLIVTGNLTVNGTTTTINTEEVTIEDNMVLLNSNLTGAPPAGLDSGIEVNLGTSGSTKLYWDQATSKWTVEGDLNVQGDIFSNNNAMWTLNGSDIYYDQGSVGIGTNSPSSLLEVRTDSANTAALISTSGLDDMVIRGSENVGLMIVSKATQTTASSSAATINFACDNSGGGTIVGSQDTQHGFVKTVMDTASEDASMHLGIKGNEYLSILDSGNVGIGTSAPSAKLTVNKGDDIGFIVQDNTTDNHRLHMMTSASDNGYYIGYASGQSEGYKLNSSGDSYFLGGNVGIGDTTPAEKLEVNGAIKLGTTSSTNAGTIRWSGSDFEGYDGASWNSLTSSGAVSSQWTTSGNDIYYNIGNVGIGTSSPSGKLDVNTGSMSGDIKIGNFDNVANGDNTSQFGEGTKLEFIADTNPRYSNHDPFTVAYVKAEYDGTGADTKTGDTSLTFATYDGFAGSANGSISEKMRITSDGNVGINTTTPSEKLEVLGNIKAINNISSATTKKYQITSSNATDEYFYLGKLQHNNGANGYANIVVYNHVDYGLQNNTRLEVQINQRSGNFTGNATLYGSRVSGENIDILCYRDSASQNIYVYAKSDSYGLSIIEVSHLGGYDWQMSQNTEGTTVPTSSGAPVDGGTEIFDSSSNIDFMVSQNGFVGIGTLSPSEKLSVVGNITATGTITSSSDIALKENIELISDPIEKVKELSGYTFNKKGEDLRMVGLIAQEVEKVLPEAVHENQEGLKSLAYGNLVALLVECVKKQDERIDQLEKTIEKLK